MKIEVLAISKLKNPEIKHLCNKYIERINGFTKFALQEIKPNTKPPNNSKLVLLHEKGKSFTSIEFAKWLNENPKTTFIIGGDNGFPKNYYDRKPELISLSSMTMQHDLARLIFLEQLYRAFTIINRHPYHRD